MRFYESPYIRWIKNKNPRPDPHYVYELNVLRAMVRGNSSRRYPKVYEAFGGELENL